uniref:60S acidic ribosomal protein P1 n=1 Tax=Entomoneis paludosa TaxID=265537 RepID=A0A7S2YT19_9STRA|mmetsp:Transcript_9006/g.18720  ORF Transcript_9006/g.18720 Transcript_9006/m.18720 type:complete len:125 (+) Transcript_9006:130-504(+)|eukprot:CAMPEP_0172438934 /NCGR_PEP_ID=MMETSP1065-20121228/49_1 /TAXON_ID=265537 /ORGANISM="Amphiprora paludosa, Strain CCMP125" /LENGTH=124 /DNA_ID=CAMNT_0013187533 /DNA_START=94 /DNA_END=468 /DNA_ORIENTATION=+
MDSLSKEQKDEFATVFAMLALYDGGAAITSDQINALLQATGNTEVEGFYPVIMANYAGDPDKLAELIALPGAGGGGGGGGGGAGGDASGEEEKEEEKEEEIEEEPVGGGMGDMFGGDDGGGGDY